MNPKLKSFLSHTLTGVIGGLVVLALQTWTTQFIVRRFDADALVKQERWQIKRAACLNALSVVDGVYANVNWSQNGKEIPIQRQPVDAIMARRCLNELAVTCDGTEVYDMYLDLVAPCEPGQPPAKMSGDQIVDLRNAIRRELGFGQTLEFRRERAWIAHIQEYKESDGEPAH